MSTHLRLQPRWSRTRRAGRELQQALALPEDEREMLAAELLASLDGPDPEYSPERADPWAHEVERRIERSASGESAGVDLATARQRVETALADG